MKNFKRFLAATLAMVMVFSVSVIAQEADAREILAQATENSADVTTMGISGNISGVVYVDGERILQLDIGMDMFIDIDLEEEMIMMYIRMPMSISGVDPVTDEILDEEIDENMRRIEGSDIVFKDVCFSYDETDFMVNLNFRFEQGKKYLIIGESGSGKSTLLKLLLKELDVNSGKILYGEVSLSELSKSSWYALVGYVPQNLDIIPGTLCDNIVLSETIDESKLNSLVEILNITHLKENMSVELDEDLSNFSGGELQRVAIARTLYKEGCKVLLFDEFTSSLDVMNAHDIERHLLSIEDRTVLNISHRFSESSLKHYDKIMVLDQGRVEYFGRYEDDTKNIIDKFVSN